ncbi:MAG: 2-oxoacid:ferredoxin oxidoreductase subunit beta [Chitinispirillaceae bacterium]|nr:2-oxoacid:ferredoxin oxidoreductase subunit beta [Chitinispirillaceae bacterium]
MNEHDFESGDEIAWCPGCGDFGILSALKDALVQLGRTPRNVLLVSGIGQAAKLPHYMNCNCFNGLHGRALPVATGAKIANKDLTVIVTTGDGDCYGEGGNHFIHAIRRNCDITVVVHDNQIYGLTKGQASPTTEPGYVTKVQLSGTVLEPLHPLETAIALGCGFVARGFSGDMHHLAGLMAAGVRHKGFALIDVLQPCVSFNHKNTFAWYRERVYRIEEDTEYDPADKTYAYRMAAEWSDKIPVGIIYRAARPTYEEKTGIDGMPPLNQHEIDTIDIETIVTEYA